MKRMRKNHESTKREGRFKREQEDVMPNSKLKPLLRRCFACAAVIVVFFTTYSMILPAITASIPTCGVEEHVHSSECYRIEKKLICENTDPEHVHSEECYSKREVLSCGKEEHVHFDECFADVGEPENKAGENTSGESKQGDRNSTDAPPYAEIDPTDPSEPGGSSDINPTDWEGLTDLVAYLDAVGGKVTDVLYDRDNKEVEFISEASGGGYTYHWEMRSPIVAKGQYYYFLPKGMKVLENFREGKIVIRSGVEIGTYKVSADSTFIKFDFDEIVEDYRDIVGIINMSVEFEEQISSAIEKSGYYVGENGEFDGYFHFNIKLQIPADREGVPKREWKVSDYSRIKYTSWKYDFSDEINAENMHVYITYGDIQRREIFNVDKVYNDNSQDIAYYLDPDTKDITLVNRCYCNKSTEEDSEERGLHCVYVDDNGKCKCPHEHLHTGWCSCWSLGSNSTVDIEYRTALGPDGMPITSDQNAIAKNGTGTYINDAILTESHKNNSGEIVSSELDAETQVTYSAFFDKKETELGSRQNNYVSTFTVEFNKEKADISKFDTDDDGAYDNCVVLTDEMNNLRYTNNMVITAEDIDNNEIILEKGTDYTVEVITNEDNRGDKLLIKLLKLGRYKYKVEYDAQMIGDSDSKSVRIENSISCELYSGGKHSDHTSVHTETYATPKFTYGRTGEYDDEWAARLYEINITKVDINVPDKTLEGAEYRLCSSDDEEIATAITDENGKCTFSTKSSGLSFVLNLDTMYYIQEKTAPQGYTLDTRKYWFYFSRERNNGLEDALIEDYPDSIITYQPPDSDTGDYILDMTLEDEELFTLPETGSWGTEMIISVGVLLLVAAAGCIILRLHKKEGAETP